MIVDNEGYLGDGNFQIKGYTPDLFQRTHEIVLDTKTTAIGNIVNDTEKYPSTFASLGLRSLSGLTTKRLLMI